MTGSDHDANSLSIEFAGAQRCEKTDTVDNRVEQLAVRGEVRYMSMSSVGGDRVGSQMPTYAFMRNYDSHQYIVSRYDASYLAGGWNSILTPAVPY